MKRKKRPKFRSKKESEFAAYLTKSGIRWEYEADTLQYLSDYSPDFSLVKSDGSKMFVEYKGYLKPTDRSKLVKVKRMNPDADIRIVFQRANNKLHRNSGTTYAEWAERHGFPWAEGEIPEDWRILLIRRSRKNGKHGD